MFLVAFLMFLWIKKSFSSQTGHVFFRRLYYYYQPAPVYYSTTPTPPSHQPVTQQPIAGYPVQAGYLQPATDAAGYPGFLPQPATSDFPMASLSPTPVEEGSPARKKSKSWRKKNKAGLESVCA